MHLLVTETATLDEIDTAVDLAQTPADVVVLSFSDSDLSALAATWTNDRNALPSLRLASLKRLRHPMSVDLYVDSVVAHARLVIVRSLGGLDYWRYGFECISAACVRDGILLVAAVNQTKKAQLLETVERLREVEAKIVGVVVNGVEPSKDRYYEGDYEPPPYSGSRQGADKRPPPPTPANGDGSATSGSNGGPPTTPTHTGGPGVQAGSTIPATPTPD